MKKSGNLNKKVLLQLLDENIHTALTRETIVKEYLKRCYSKKSSATRSDKDKFVQDINTSGYGLILAQLGKTLTYTTLERWKKLYLDHKKDYKVLIPKYSKVGKRLDKDSLNKILIQITLLTDKTILPDIQKEAISMIKAGRIEIYSLNDIGTGFKYLLKDIF